MRVAQARASAGDVDGALFAYERAFNRSPGNGSLLKEAGQLAYETKRYSDATRFFRRALSLDYNDQRALRGLAFALHADGSRDEAVYRYFRYLDTNRDDYDALLNLSALFLDSGEYEQAIEYSERAGRADPAKAAPLHNIALAYFNLGKFSEGEASIRRALTIDRSGDSLRLLGLLLESQDKTEEALEHYKEACSVSPQFAQAYLDVARLQGELGQYPDYLVNAQKAVELFKNDDNRDGLEAAYWNLGWAYYSSGEWEKSTEASRKALDLEPNSAPPRFNLALALLFQGQSDEAKKEYKRAVKNSSISNLKADGIDDLQAALRKRPDLPGGHECLDLLLTEYGKLETQRLGDSGLTKTQPS